MTARPCCGCWTTTLGSAAEHAESIRDLPELARHNPFDRLIVARAARTGLRLLTACHVLLDLGRDVILDARH